MSRRIVILPDAVANRIAAGEVVERPASALKELLENSLDAGATAVSVEIENGGKTLVRVADDGEGMGREDALLALDRHATSKVRSADDLVGIATFGFRGEALPSIASVSRFEMETATADGPVGTRVVATGGLVSVVEDCARRPGTTVSVRSLFFNTPARRKFLRSARSEQRLCVEIVATLALARPGLAVSLTADGRVVLEVLPARDMLERVAQVLGGEFASTLVPVEYARDGIRVHGLVQRPADCGPSGRRAFLFVNDRPLRDHFLVRAAERGYRATVPAGARPSLLLALAVPHADVDVNVHPAKLEVRFRDRYLVEAVMEEAVHRALGELVAAAPIGRLPWGLGVPHRAGAQAAAEGTAPSPYVSAPQAPSRPAGLFDTEQPLSQESVVAEPGTHRVVAQLLNTYLLVETPDGLLIVDQHSAHERILFERAMSVLSEGGGASQHLLFPVTLELDPRELDALEANRELMARLGFEVEPFGGHGVVMRSAPSPHARFDAARCLRELAADLAGNRFGALANRLERFASTYACRAAIKAGLPLTRAEMDELVARLFACALPAHDVHGRPTVVQLPVAELERRFGRR